MMQITPLSPIGALALLGLLFPTTVAAQAGEACGAADTLLMYCTFNDGAKQVGLCLAGNTVTYAFGAAFSNPELSLSVALPDLGYVPYGWASTTIFESVILSNGNTTYEVFSAIARGPDPDPAVGGITVTTPQGKRQTLTCDPGSIWPDHPMDGIGLLAATKPNGGAQVLARCLSFGSDPLGCVGAVRGAEISQERCIAAQDPTDCWAVERDAWDIIVAQELTVVLAKGSKSRGPDFAQDIDAAQDIWEQARAADCTLILDLPFAADGGAAKCQAAYAAERIGFLQAIIAAAEFDG